MRHRFANVNQALSPMPASTKFQLEEPKIGTRFAQHFENPYNINAVSSLQVKTLEVPEHEILRQKKSS